MNPAASASDDRSVRKRASPLDQARHDVCNPLGEILGLSELFLEEARAAGHSHLLADAEAIHQSASQLLARVNSCLTPNVLKDNPALLDELAQSIRTNSDQMIAAARKLVEQGPPPKSLSFADNLAPVILSSARQLSELAPVLVKLKLGMVPPEAGARPIP